MFFSLLIPQGSRQQTGQPRKQSCQMVEYEKPEINQVFKITLGNSED
jgi:hypothetical protein